MNNRLVRLLFPLFLFIVSLSFFTKCTDNNVYRESSLYDNYGQHVCDSIFENNLVTKVIFSDTLFEIDSIVFTRFKNPDGSLKSKETFKNAQRVFENIYYHPNGKLANYYFFDEDHQDFYYERQYNINGQLENTNGELFYQGFIVDSPKTEGIYSVGTKVTYRIYFPSPPDCDTRIYIRNDDGSIYDVFKRSSVLGFLETASQTTSEQGTFKLKIFLELRDRQKNEVSEYINEIVYQVK